MPAAALSATVNDVRIKEYKFWDRLFVALVLFNFLLVGGVGVIVKNVKVEKEDEREVLKKLPPRIAKFIIDKPKLPDKIKAGPAKAEPAPVKEAAVKEGPAAGAESAAGGKHVASRQTQQAIAKRAQRIERNLRSAGVLALITGVGPSHSRLARSVDILGPSQGNFNISGALKNIQGLQTATTHEVVEAQLTTKAVKGVSAKADINNMIENLGKAQDVVVKKLGSINVSKPQVTGTAQASANRDEESITSIVRSNLPRLQAIYNRSLKMNPDLKGKIIIKFTIVPDGSVSDVEMVSSTFGDADFENSMLLRVRQWKFPAIKEEKNLTVTYPFVFQPSG
jgi:TonB family protein